MFVDRSPPTTLVEMAVTQTIFGLLFVRGSEIAYNFSALAVRPLIYCFPRLQLVGCIDLPVSL